MINQKVRDIICIKGGKMEDKECGIERWTDEKGNKVLILSHFSKVYLDEEVQQLRGNMSDYYGEPVCSSLGSAGLEHFVAKVLSLVKNAVIGDGFSTFCSFCGVEKDELLLMAMREHYSPDYVYRLIQPGYLREKWIMEKVVLFPTEKLLKNQKIL